MSRWTLWPNGRRIIMRVIGLLVCIGYAFGVHPTDGVARAQEYSALPFQKNYAAIELAAQSVMMLEVYDENNALISTGSGFLAFDSQLLITNAHVLEGAHSVIAYDDLSGKHWLEEVLAYDLVADIAILRFEHPMPYTPLELSTRETLLRAEPVVAIGSPIGIQNTVTLGNISAIWKEKGKKIIQFTAPISVGSSGGALFDEMGKVIGMTTAFWNDSQNMNLAIDIAEVRAFYEASGIAGQLPFDSADDEPAEVVQPLKVLSWPDAEPAVREEGTSPAVGTIDGLEIVQTGPNAIRVRWKQTTPGRYTYQVRYVPNVLVETQTLVKSTTDTAIDLVNLVPSMKYTVWVSQWDVELDAAVGDILTGSVQIEMSQPYAVRDFVLSELSIVSCPAGADFWSATRTPLQTLTERGAQSIGVTEDYGLVIGGSLARSTAPTDVELLYVVTTPSTMTVYTDQWVFPAEAYTEYAFAVYVNDILYECYRSAQEHGIYGQCGIIVFFDGQYVGQTVFQVE